MKESIEAIITNALSDALKSLGSLPQGVGEKAVLDIPSNASFGDYSSNLAMTVASQTKQSPLELGRRIREALKAHLDATGAKKYLRSVKVQGPGFINFFLSEDYFRDYLKGLVSSGDDFLRTNLGEGRRVLIEFVSANPTGPLSVAHARQAAVGDALANILAFAGFRVKREYYLNDEGNQITILGSSIEARLKELSGERIEFPENFYQGDYVIDLAKRIKEEHLAVGDFSEYGLKDISRTIEEELNDFSVRFDNWYSQKELRESGKIQKALELLKEKGLAYEQDGALWFKSSEFGDDKDRVVVKSDGSYTYLAPDIAYHRDKYERGFQWLINLWGPDHHGYIHRLKASVSALGYPSESLSIVIVQLATILRDGKLVEMSTRKGQYITLREVLREVGPDASRFFFLMRRTSSHLDFDLEVAKKQTSENPVYYVQYAYARISSILRQAQESGPAGAADCTLLREKEELQLIRTLWQFPYIVKVCVKTLDPYMMTVYLQELSESFHRFYDRHRVLTDDNRLTCARLYLIRGIRSTLDKGLELLGISRPQKM
ncbi:MAG: arginine--tRNA ligase [Candidatus Omnitrophica bacterium]|nr:arginine--tRNA ligase [Candidatus Omnitrophota bacterium]